MSATLTIPSRTRKTRRIRRPRQAQSGLDEVQHIVLDDVSWSLYERFLKETGDQSIRLTFDDGELEIMSPLCEHDTPKTTLGRIVETLTEELSLPCTNGGSTTFRVMKMHKGLEPDACFYIANQPLIRGKKWVTLPKDPPPDLAIEIDITRRSIPRLPIYAALKVPEIWRYDGKKVQCLHLRSDGEYHEAEKSLSFAMMRPADLLRFIKQAEALDQTTIAKSFRKWVRKQGWAK